MTHRLPDKCPTCKLPFKDHTPPGGCPMCGKTFRNHPPMNCPNGKGWLEAAQWHEAKQRETSPCRATKLEDPMTKEQRDALVEHDPYELSASGEIP